MNSFSISELSRFSGIKAHTIRIWEQRYNALQPHRTQGNTRFYNNNQLRRLLNIVSLSEMSFKISELCLKSDSELFKLIEEVIYKEETGQEGYFISQLVGAGIDFDEAAFEKIFSVCLLRFGLKQTYIKVLYPVLVRFGLMWTSNAIPPTHEHFTINLIRQKLFTAIDSQPSPHADSETWVLFLPEDEFHEIGLLFANFLLKSYGKKTIYLGGNVPLDSINALLINTAAENVLLFIVHQNSTEVIKKYLEEINSSSAKRNIFVAGSEKFTEELGNINSVTYLHSVDTFEHLIVSLN